MSETPENLLRDFQNPRGQAPAELCIEGQDLAAAGMYSLALVKFEEAVALDPNYGLGWSDLGICLAKLDRFEEAERALRRATELAPDNPGSWECLATTCVHLAKFADAQGCLDRFRKLAPDNPRLTLLARQISETMLGHYDPRGNCQAPVADIASALILLHDVEQLSHTGGDELGTARCLIAQALVMFSLNNGAESVNRCEQATRILRRHENETALLMFALSLSVILFQDRFHEPGEALLRAREALGLAERLQDAEMIELLRKRIGEIDSSGTKPAPTTAPPSNIPRSRSQSEHEYSYILAAMILGCLLLVVQIPIVWEKGRWGVGFVTLLPGFSSVLVPLLALRMRERIGERAFLWLVGLAIALGVLGLSFYCLGLSGKFLELE